MAFSLGGLASGIDTTSLVDGLVAVARQPINAVTSQKAEIDVATQTISSFASKLSTLKTAALALSTSVGFASFSATSSDAAVVASATGSANPGSYSVVVDSLARAQKTRSQTFASSSTALGAEGSLAIKVAGGEAVNVAVTATDTLADVASKITASGARVTASVFNDGTGYRLLVHGLDTGDENSFTIAETDVTFGFDAPDATYETAANASLTVDGMPVTSKTNQITGLIAGVKLALTKTTTSPVTVQVSTDSAALEKKISAFVSAYNDFVNSGHAAAGFGATKASTPTLRADSAIRSALHRIGRLMSSPIPNTSGGRTTLYSVGITGKQDGTFTFDATKLQAAIAEDPAAVRRIFVTDTATGATGIMSTLMSTIDALSGKDDTPLQARLAALGARSKRLADTKTKMESRLTDYETLLKKQFASMDQQVGRYQAMQASITSITKTSNNNQ